MTTTDERRGKPSASHVERLMLCPGSWQLERTLPPSPESEDAASGTRIHAAMAGDMVALSPSETETMEMCMALEVKTLLEVLETDEPETTHREKRLWLDEDESISGKADVIFQHGKRALILDAKTGRNEVESASSNLQLRTLAVLWFVNHVEVDDITVGIIQPWVSPQVSLSRYTCEHLIQATDELDAILDEAESPNAKRVPGEKQCKYCRAKAVCPEARNYALTTLHNPEQSVSTLTGEALGDYLGRLPLVETIVEALKVEAKRRLTEDPSSVPGWELKPGAQKETITNPQTVFNRFSEQGGDVAGFLACITVAKGKLEDALRLLNPALKGKSLKEAVRSLVDGCTETKANAASLVRSEKTP